MTDPTNSLGTLAGLMASLEAAAAKTAPKPVAVPELGGTVFVMPLTTAEWLDSERNALPPTATAAQRRAWGVARWLCDASGARLMQPSDTAALDLFAALPWEASHRILNAVGMLDEAAEKNV